MRIVREHINEKFTEDSDPIKDMGIGMEAQIKKFVKGKGHYYNLDRALWICAKHGKLDFVKFLLYKEVDVHGFADLALRVAIENGHAKVVELLLQHGADIHMWGDYPLRYASENGHKDVVKVLKDHIAKENK